MTDRPGRTGPKYRQIADDLRARIASGELKPGDTLPTRPALMKDHGVAANTVERAIEVLRQEGLVESSQGARTYVRKVPEMTMAEWMAQVERRFGDLEGLRPKVDFLECQVMDTRAAIGLEQSRPDDEAAAR